MNQLRLDPLSGRWVVVSPGRSERPYSFVTRSPWQPDGLGRPCPFCPGNEEDTPPALETYGPTGGWLVRVVPNLYPAFEGDEPFVVANRGPVFTQATAGRHPRDPHLLARARRHPGAARARNRSSSSWRRCATAWRSTRRSPTSATPRPS